MAELLTKEQADAQAASTPTVDPTLLEDAAELVLSLLPGHIADQIRENAIVFNRIPLAYTVAGLVLRCHEDGTSNAPILDPSWPRKFQTLDPIAGATYACEVCTTRFKPRRYKQRTCGKAECGTEIQKRDAATPQPRPRRALGVRLGATR